MSAVGVPYMTSNGETITLRVHPKTAPAFRALAAVFRAHRYPFREMAGGTLSCRSITGGTYSSLHAHGIALDINPSKNGYRKQVGPIQWGRHTDMSPEMIRDVEKIRTNNGAKVFQWGGRWTNIKDPMHFQINCSPSDLATGINLHTVVFPIAEDEVVLQKGMEGKAVKDMQGDILAWNWQALPTYKDDGDFGDETVTWVKKFQQSQNLPENGIVDGVALGQLARYRKSDVTTIDNEARSAASAATRQAAIAQAAANKANNTISRIKSVLS